LQTDSAAADSMKQLLHDRLLTLRMFKEEDTIQSFIKRINPQKGNYSLIFRRPVKTLQVNTLRGDLPEYFQFENAGKDTITWFFKTPLTDTVELELITDNLLTDTIELKPFAEPRKSRGGSKDFSRLTLTLLPTLYGFEPLILQSSFPLKPSDSIPYTLLEIVGRDTVEHRFSLTVPDSLVLRLVLDLDLKERTNYVLLFKDSLFKGYNDLTNDSLQISFTTKSTRDFGNLVLQMTTVPRTPVIVQLILNKKTVAELFAPNKTTLTFDWLPPGEYILRWIEDLNENGVWDTGNYDLKRFPEPVHLWRKKLTVRAGWDLEEEVEF